MSGAANDDLNKKLFDSAIYGDIKQIKKALDAGADINAADGDNGWTPLMYACERMDTKEVLFLIEHGADVNKTGHRGHNALILACMRGHTDIVRLLLDHGAYMNAADKYGQNAFIKAILKGYTDIVTQLLDRGADVNYVNDSGDTALIAACITIYVNKKTIRSLLRCGADPNIANADGYTPLMYLAEGGHTPLMKYLIKAGADPGIVNHNGKTAFDILKEEHPEKYAKWIEHIQIRNRRQTLRKEDGNDITGHYADWEI